MNPQPELQSDALRSEIDTTRERMDDTIDAIGNRLEGRHLIDELIGFFRGRSGNGQGSALGERLSHSAETALHSVVNSVKAHPIPTLMVGAGLAWLVYETRTRKPRAASYTEDLESDATDYTGYGAETYEGEAATGTAEVGGVTEGIASKAAGVAEQAREKLSDIGGKTRRQMATVRERGREKLDTAKEKLGHLSADVQHRSREIYGATRQRVVTTADQHPLELGLGCLAVGLIVGLALPTPSVINQKVGPTVDRLRDRTREAGSELLEKGKRVVQAAASAAKVEAKTQGLSVSRLRGGSERPGEGNASAESTVGESAGSGTGGGSPAV